ncbi:hypothetical protein AcV5_009890 [Taiwanofungus camphoratus]|nr:hypothetical protein AcV5_009890 [Antrodia cinnamomea]KAI0926596.1 hypothetical protein AcV7_005489 [Antrodia cinnamomea]
MPLPANDAFTLGLPHDPSRPSYSLGLHSSSSTLPFVKGSKTTNRNTSSGKRLMSAGRTNVHDSPRSRSRPHANDNHNSDPARPPAEQGKRKDLKDPSAPKVPVDWEIPRKILHSSIGFLTLYLYVSRGSPRAVVVVLSAGLAVIAPLDILRFRSPGFERLYERCVGFLMRESEKTSTNGVIWYLIGVIFVLAVYPIDIAVVSILILSWADTAASTIGRLWGSLTPPLPRRIPILNIPLAPRKSLAGFLAASVTGACIAVGFWGWLVPLCNTESSWHAIGGAKRVPC